MGGKSRKRNNGSPIAKVKRIKSSSGLPAGISSAAWISARDEKCLELTSSPNDAVRQCRTVETFKSTFTERKDDVQLLTIFPEEIWIFILNNVTDSTDLENISNASLFFRNLLWSKRQIFLFPKVWSVLGLKCETDHDEAYCGYDLKREDVPFVAAKAFKSMSSRERVGLVRSGWGRPYYHGILSMRLVCRPWTLAIDDFYQNLAYHYNMKHDPDWRKLESEEELECESSSDPPGKWNSLSFYPENHPIINTYLEYFEQTHENVGDRCPFFGRSLTFRCRKRETFMMTRGRRYEEERVYHGQQYWAAITNLLRKYGHHVWYCILDIEDTFPARDRYYYKMAEWLELMPNLKTVSIMYSRIGRKFVDFSSPPILANFHPASPQEVSQLDAGISTKPFPKLHNLEYIYVENLPSSVYTELMSQNYHVPMLESKRDKNFPLWNYDMSLKTMTNLTQLSLQILNEVEFAQLEASQGDWRLTKLYLSFKHCPYLSWPRIFKMVETKWRNTLTNVLLKLPAADCDEDKNVIMRDCSQYVLDLLRIKRLKLKMYNLSSLDFILPMKDILEWLDVTFEYDVGLSMETKLGISVTENQRIQILGWFDGLEKSNIWQIFPKLKRIDLVESEGTYNSWENESVRWCIRTERGIKTSY